MTTSTQRSFRRFPTIHGDFWEWVDAGCPQRWAFWRLRDELDGVWMGAALGLAVVSAVVLAVWL